MSVPIAFGAEPQRLGCPHCHAEIITRVENEPTTSTHLFALLLCLTCLWPCACCVYCADGCQSQKHYCPSCNAYIGQHTN